MNKGEFIKQVQRRVAQTSIGPSAIRNQGASGLITICREFFEKKINLIEFKNNLVTNSYKDYLDYLTSDLKNSFPTGGKSWGAARKALNLFFRDVVYNKYLADQLKIPTDWQNNIKELRNLEVPLDRDVATQLISIYVDLPRWTTIKDLNKKTNILFQERALLYADKKGIARVHLDLEFWRKS